MQYRLKMLKRRVAVACLLATLSMTLLRAEEPAPAPKAADLVQVVDIRVNKAGQSMQDLKAFLDNGAPVASAMVMGNVTPVLLHTNGMDGIDANRPVHLLVYLPKQVFTATPEELDAMDPEPMIVQLLPVSDAKAWTDKLGEDVDEIVKDGDYSKFKQPNMGPGDVFMKIAGKFAVLGISKEAVDVGVAQVDAVAAADAARKTSASFQLEIRPHDLFNATGLDQADNRKKCSVLMGIILREGSKEAAREAGVRNMAPTFTDDDIQQISDLVYQFGQQAESVQMNATFTKDAANLGYAIEAATDSNLAKIIGAMKALNLKSLTGLPNGTKIVVTGGTFETELVKLVDKLVAKMPAEARDLLAPSMDMVKAAEGQPFTGYMGVDQDGKLQGAGELAFKEGTDIAKQLAAVQAVSQKIAAQMKAAKADAYVEYVFGETKEVDGWSYQDTTTTLKSDDQEKMQELAMSSMFINNPMHTAMLVKGTRLVFATANSAEAALAAAQAYADRKAGLGLKPEFKTWLEKDAADRNAACELLFDPYPLVKRAIAMFVQKPEVTKLAEQTIGTLNPLQAAIYAKDNTVQAELRVEAESVKQWTAFVMQMMMMGQNPDNGGMEPDMVEPAQPGGDF